MDSRSLVTEQIDSGGRFLAEFAKSAPIQAAFWLNEGEGSDWNLFVVSDQISDDNFDLAYAEVARIAAQLNDPWFDPFQVKVRGSEDPLAKAFISFQQAHPQLVHGWFPGQKLQSLNVNEAFIYPLPQAVTP